MKAVGVIRDEPGPSAAERREPEDGREQHARAEGQNDEAPQRDCPADPGVSSATAPSSGRGVGEDSIGDLDADFLALPHLSGHRKPPPQTDGRIAMRAVVVTQSVEEERRRGRGGRIWCRRGGSSGSLLVFWEGMECSRHHYFL